MKEYPIVDYGIIYFENEIPHSFLDEILEVIEEMRIKMSNWYFIILFLKNDVLFENVLGICQKIKIGKEPIFQNAPEYVVEKIHKKSQEGIRHISCIFHPNKLLCNESFCLEEKIHFFWHFIHELQHLFQDQSSAFDLAVINAFLREYFLDVERKKMLEIQLLLPLELDAEKKAKQIVTEKFGEEGFLNYIDYRVKLFRENHAYFEVIKGMDFRNKINVYKEIESIFVSKRDSLKIKLNEFHSQGKFIDVDIDNALNSLHSVCWV